MTAILIAMLVEAVVMRFFLATLAEEPANASYVVDCLVSSLGSVNGAARTLGMPDVPYAVEKN